MEHINARTVARERERERAGPRPRQRSSFPLIAEGQPPTEVTKAARGAVSFLSWSQEEKQTHFTSAWWPCAERLPRAQHVPRQHRGLGKGRLGGVDGQWGDRCPVHSHLDADEVGDISNINGVSE